MNIPTVAVVSLVALAHGGATPAPLATIGSNEQGGYGGPMIVYSRDGKACDLGAFARAAVELSRFLSPSDEIAITPAIYRSPADQLRHEAEQIEAQDKAIRAFREQLESCSWVAEPEAFDR